MIDATAVIMILGFIATIGTLGGMIFWFDRKQSARMDRMEKRFDDMDDRQRAMQIDLAEVKAELKAQGERMDRQDERFDRQDERFERQSAEINARFDQQSAEINAVGRKVDRVEGMVYVLIHGPNYRERGLGIEDAREEEVSEPVGDD